MERLEHISRAVERLEHISRGGFSHIWVKLETIRVKPAPTQRLAKRTEEFSPINK
ncbi:hypothetical protein [Coleofasciculus sp. G2-EDA-02]|uniref:hypothetical protein n=1 Tax=Coleofasciculus sp. G2-EDA-02 TaxID=3069529 RepID=UPI004062A3A5